MALSCGPLRVAGSLGASAVTAIADLGTSVLDFDQDVAPAFQAVGIAPVREQASFRSGDVAVSYFFPICRDHIRCTLDSLDLGDPAVVDRVLRFVQRITEVYRAGRDADQAKLVRVRHALADDGNILPAWPDANGGDLSNVSIDKRAIAKMMEEMQREFDKHPIRVPVEADPSTVAVAGGQTTINYNGPVIHGDATGAQLAWGNDVVTQSQNRAEQVAPGFETLATAVAMTLQGLPEVGLPKGDQADAAEAAQGILVEVTQPQPDQGRIRSALHTLKGILGPVALGLVSGTASGAEEWARTAVEQLGK